MRLKEMDASADLRNTGRRDPFQKSYYTIGTVAEMFKVNQSLIRLWKMNSIFSNPQERQGARLFRPEDVKNLKLIFHLLRERKCYTMKAPGIPESKINVAEEKFRTYRIVEKAQRVSPGTEGGLITTP